MKEITAWWPRNPKPGNMGDIITPMIIKKIFKKDLLWRNIKGSKKEILIATGSIINKASHGNVTVWGSGAMREGDGKQVSSKARILAVRGPVTRDILHSNNIKVPEVFGDPGLLLPEFFYPKVTKEYEIGIIPHYVDYEEIKAKYEKYPAISIIDVLHENPLIPIHQIMKCKRTISSSLHGIIFSNAYNIPSAWVKFSSKLCGDGAKFKDYFNFCGKELSFIETDFVSPNDFDKLFYVTLNDSPYHNNKKLIEAFKGAYP